MRFSSFHIFSIVCAFCLVGRVSCGRGINYGQYVVTASPDLSSSKSPDNSNPKWKSLRRRIGKVTETVCTGSVERGPKLVHQVIFVLTATDALQSVMSNNYERLRTDSGEQNYGAKLFRLAARLLVKPRLMYVVGALLRALQLSTPLQMVIDPSIGVGAGINLCAMLARSQWLKALVLGWATTKCFWKWMGATNVNTTSVPITLSIRDLGISKDP